MFPQSTAKEFSPCSHYCVGDFLAASPCYPCEARRKSQDFHTQHHTGFRAIFASCVLATRPDRAWLPT